MKLWIKVGFDEKKDENVVYLRLNVRERIVDDVFDEIDEFEDGPVVLERGTKTLANARSER